MCTPEISRYKKSFCEEAHTVKFTTVRNKREDICKKPEEVREVEQALLRVRHDCKPRFGARSKARANYRNDEEWNHAKTT